MIICSEAFLDAPEACTRWTTLGGSHFDPEVSLDYTADEQGLLVHDWFDGTLYLLDLTQLHLPATVIGRGGKRSPAASGTSWWTPSG
jgi:hypothetical protein